MGSLEHMDVFATYFSEKLPFVQCVLPYGILFILDVLYILSPGVGSVEGHGARRMGIRSHAGRKIWQSLGPELSLDLTFLFAGADRSKIRKEEFVVVHRSGAQCSRQLVPLYPSTTSKQQG